MLLYFVASSLFCLLVYLVLKLWTINQHWQTRGVPHIKPVIFFGNLLDVVLKKRSFDEVIKSLYDAFPNEPIIGYYHFMFPRLIIRDLDLVEKVLIKDFSHFVDRVVQIDINRNPLTVNLFGLSGNMWRAVRTKFSPMFTTGKLRHMLPQINVICDKLIKLLERTPHNINMKEEAGKFATDVIGSCAFGIEPGALDKEENEFQTETKLVFQASLSSFLRAMLNLSLPNLARALNITFPPFRSIKYFSGILRNTLSNRKESSMERNDFVQLMLTLQKKGFIDIENYDPNDDYLNISNSQHDAETMKLELTDDVMIGQAFVFLVAGFETISTAMVFVALELAANPKAQDIARREAQKALQKHGDLTYDCIKDIHYLDWCLKEALRLHPPVGTLMRRCVKLYPLPGTSIEVNFGETVMIPSYAIHMDPNIYLEPDKFKPERWSAEEKYPSCTYLPFGDGPRMCIGMRFAQIEVKIFLVKMLTNYKIKLHPSVKLPVRMNPHSFLGVPKDKVLLDLEKIAM